LTARLPNPKASGCAPGCAWAAAPWSPRRARAGITPASRFSPPTAGHLATVRATRHRTGRGAHPTRKIPPPSGVARLQRCPPGEVTARQRAGDTQSPVGELVGGWPRCATTSLSVRSREFSGSPT